MVEWTRRLLSMDSREESRLREDVWVSVSGRLGRGILEVVKFMG